MGADPLVGDRTERSNDLREPPTSPRGFPTGSLPFSALLGIHFRRVEGVWDPSPPPLCSLKISGDCLYSADFPLVPLQRELRWKSIHSQSAPFQVRLGLALTWTVPGRALPPLFLCGLFLPQIWFLSCHPHTLSFNPEEETQAWGRSRGVGRVLILLHLSCWGLS